ncbi:class I adenylate-forming enzyme family protein [Aeromicrobium alkaliterrae]|uniref:Fatty acid--CoA ligase n=1 Tax=Aeromicrobium alkaliterrae TaxID=302168 RepID=A0ABP4W3U5_9ACTN
MSLHMNVPLHMAAGIREFGRSSPNRDAVVDGDRRLSFAGLDDRSSRLAAGLLDQGLTPGEPVAVLSGNRMEYFEIAAGLAKAGLPMVPLNPKNQASDNAYILGHSEARAIIVDDTLAAGVEGTLDGLSTVVSLTGEVGRDYETFLATSRAVDPFVDVRDDDAFCITYTSGTTGLPKGVVLTHRARVINNYLSALEWGLGPSSSTMAVAPMYHGAGFAFAYAGPQTGGTTAVLRSWNPEQFLEGLVRDRVSTVFLVPTHAQQIRRFVEDPMVKYDLSALKTLYFNAAALPIDLKKWVHEAFPGVGIHELYGSTECAVVTTLRPEESLRKAGSVGHPWFFQQVRLVGEDGQEVGPNEPGELYAKSPMLMKGYLKNEEATREGTDADGFFSVGDIAVRDEEGFISIVDRKKDMIIAGGVNIYPREIEEVVAQHPHVDDVAVVGLPDDVYGERIAAFVVARRGVSLDVAGVEEHVKGGVAKFKVPREWHVVDELPRNPSGKILKRDIRDQHIAHVAASAP